MTKSDLVEAVASQAGRFSRKSAGELVELLFDAIGRAIRTDGRFSYPRFGTFSVRLRRARRGRNPRTGAEMRIAATRTVGFRPAKELKASLSAISSSRHRAAAGGAES
jgi:DNA-binding protein HU-beta